MKTPVHIVGAGFAGLTLALKLAEKGIPVTIYEASDRVGGLLGTEITDYGIAEKAANALIRSENSVALFEDLKITQSTPLPSAKKRFIFRNSGPNTWPLSIFETLKLLFKVTPRLVFKGKVAFKPLKQETLREWGLRILGAAPTNFILEPAMQGIYGNEIKGLSATLILGGLFKPKKSTARYGGLLTGPGGMQDLVDRLHQKLIDLKVSIRLNNPVQVDKLQGTVVIATSASAASHVLANSAPEISKLLSQVKMTSLMTCTLFFKAGQKDYQGFGCLIPRGLNIKTLGILMNSYIFQGRDKTYNETWILGGIAEKDILQKSDSEILKILAEERFKVLDRKDELLDYRITRWDSALPYYGLELESVLQKLSTYTDQKYYLHGNYLSGIGLTKILDRSIELAEKISRTHA